MNKALIIGEIKSGELTKVTLEMASKGKELGFDLAALVFGANQEAVTKAGNYGVSHASFNDSKEYNGEVIARTIADAVKLGSFDVVLFPHSWMGRDVAGRVGALLDTAVISDITAIENDGGKLVARKPVYAGKAFVKVAHKKGIKVFTVRPNVFEVKENKSDIKVDKVEADFSASKSKQVEFKTSQGSQIGLTEANIIVSGGRGIKGPEYFPVLQELADMLGAALGASRATVDAGWIDHSHQVGQTGKTVSPVLYIAVGISGAIQHLAGMGSSRFIVAINKDSEAPIFKVATYGVVDDLFNIVPPFKDEIKKIKG
jgi:electron transfer flavoprotein alpha subunit